MRIHNKFQALKLFNQHLIAYPTPVNLNWSWNFGSLAGLLLGSQMLTGILLAMHYVPHVDLAFSSVIHLMNDVPSGMIIRYAHANGASLFFATVYLHILRGIYYSSGNQPREIVWLSGVVILLVMIITAFIGYVLPWGQMSFWGDFICPTCRVISVFLDTFCIDSSLCYMLMPCISLRRATAFLKTGDSRAISHSPLKGQKRILAKQRIGPHSYSILCAIFGSLLGDAYAEQRSGSTRICFQQESSNMEHLMALWKLFNDGGYCSDDKPEITTRVAEDGRTRFVIRFKTFSYISFNWIHEAFYSSGIKTVPSIVADYLSPLALAIWIMDDGTWQGYSVRIATNSFSYDNIVLLCNVLKDKYGITATPIKVGFGKDGSQHYNLYIHAESLSTLRELVKPHFVAGMLYKLGL
jgi:ubiquinol-cytochrome c reductase cytochrome b subunit